MARNRAERRAEAKQSDPATSQARGGGHPDFPMEYALTGTAGKLTLRFAVPASLALRWEVASSDNPQRARFASLGLCSAVVRKHVPYRHQGIAAYGLAVADWLLSEGVEWRELVDAANVAWLHLVHDLVTEQEVKDAEVFSAPPEESSTS